MARTTGQASNKLGNHARPGVRSRALQALIFDMDGVLIDSHPVHRKAWQKFLTTLGKEVTDEELNYILEGRRGKEILCHFLGDLSESAVVEYGRLKQSFFQDNLKDIRLVPGVRSFMHSVGIAGLSMGVATSASSYRTWQTLKRLKLDAKFSAVVTGDDVPVGKPDPAIYRLAAERMKIAPERLLAIEDAPCGVQAAKAAGIRCIGVASNGRAEDLRQSGAEDVIPNFTGLTVERLLALWGSVAYDRR